MAAGLNDPTIASGAIFKKLELARFNDSTTVFSSQVDNHQLLGHGEIWAQHNSSMNYMLNRIERLKIPALLE